MNAMINTAVAQFRQSLSAIAQTLDSQALTPEFVSSLSKALLTASTEATRDFLRAYLESRDSQAPTIEHEGRLFRRKTTSVRTVMTIFGQSQIERAMYQQDCGGRAFFPLDAQIGIHGAFATPEVREASLYLLAHVTPKECESILKKVAIFQPSATAIQHMCNSAGEAIAPVEESLLAEVRASESAPQGALVLAASLDGATVLLKEHGVQKGRPAARPGEGPSGASAYRTAMVGSITFYGAVPEGEKSPERLVSRYVARMPEDNFPTMRERFEAELSHAHAITGKDLTRVLLCDGARALWSYADACPALAGYVRILDFYHATEHLSKAAEAIFGQFSPKATAWYRRWRGKLLEDQDAVLALIRSLARYEQPGLPKLRREELRKQRIYFEHNAAMMKYFEYRQGGLPIGSGVVEAACKTIVKQRLCRSGMRWSREGGQKILQLRTIIQSGRWDRYWREVAQAEQQRELLSLVA